MTATYTQPALIPLPKSPQGARSPRTSPVRVEGVGPSDGAANTVPTHARPAVIRLGRASDGRFTPAPDVHAVTDDVLAAVHTDHLPNRVASREAIRQAVIKVAREHGNRVHISWVRPLVPEWARGPQLGAALHIWTMAGCLANTGEYLPNGDPSTKNRNASKPAPVKLLVASIPAENVAA